MAMIKLLCFTLLMALAHGDDLDLINLFSTDSESSQKASSYNPVFAQKFDTSALENFDLKPKYQHFQTSLDSPTEGSSSTYQRSILHDLAAPVTAQPSSRRAVHDLDDVELTSVGSGNIRNHRNKFTSARLTDNYQDDEVVDRERREETDTDVVDSVVKDDSDHSGMSLPLRSSAYGSIIRGINMTQGDVRGRQLESCEVHPNKEHSNMYDFTCGCNQQLGTQRPIGNLVLNHTDCNHGLWIIWSELESSLSPLSIVFVGASFALTNQTVNEVFTSTIKNLTFINSNFMDIPMDAFMGLKALEELRFVHCTVINVAEHAVRNHHKLKTIEIVRSKVGIINKNAFLNLPAIVDFGISYSTLKDINSLGINLDKPGTDENKSCLGRSSSRYSMNDVVKDYSKEDIVMSRQIQGAGNLNLPGFGTRFLLYKNSIQNIHTNAVNSNAFGFLILGGNNITHLKPQAFNMQLHNPCEISAALFSSNHISNLSNQSLAGISNKMNSNNSTFIALNNNIFGDVQVQGFQIEKGIKIFSVEENHFECNCKNLYRFLTHQPSSTSFQTELQMQIISKAKCTTGESLEAFKSSSCEGTTHVPKWGPHNTHMSVTYTPNPTPQPEVQTTSAAPPHSNLVVDVACAAASVFSLMNLHRTLLY